MSIKILIGADIAPTKYNFDLFTNANLNVLLGSELSALLSSADYTVFNLETPLTDKLSPLTKNGPCLYAPTSSINGLKAINRHFFTLANNHILDQGIPGLDSTIACLEQAGINYAGIGVNLAQAAIPYITTIKDIKLGIYCCAEHEFSIATENTPGANPYEPLVSFDAVRELKTRCDYVIVLYHGGKEHYRFPSPQLQRIFRKFAECGANLVVAQHTHCVGCMEEYCGGTLVYGQGNFLFDNSNNEYWKTNILIELVIDEQTKQPVIRYIPCAQHKHGVRLADTSLAQQILKDFNCRSQQIQKTDFIEQQYTKFSEQVLPQYLQNCSGWLGRNLAARILNKLTGYRLFTWLFYRHDFLRIQNILDCEAHREVFIQAIREKTR